MELTRGIPPAMLAALGQTSYPVLFVYLDWPGEPLRAHTAVGDIEWGGHVWKGVGRLGRVSIPPEGSSVGALEAVFSLSGVGPEIEDYLADNIRNQTAQVYIGMLTDRPGGADGKQPCVLVSDPVEFFAGIMDGLNLTDTLTEKGMLQQVDLIVSTGVSARANASVFHSDEDQRRNFPNDTAGRLVIFSFAKAQKLTWPES